MKGQEAQVTMHNPRPKYDIPPAPCRECGSLAWWNGSRAVAPVRRGADGEVVHETGTKRRRARCSLKDCPMGSWTVYEESDYPHRVFQLDVVVNAVCMVVVGASTLTAAARAYQCSRDSVRRWLHWVEALSDPRDLEQLCSRLDSDGLPPPSLPQAGRAARVIALLERLVEILSSRGVELPRRGAGLVRLLADRLERFGEVFYLTKSSPPLRADRAGLCL